MVDQKEEKKIRTLRLQNAAMRAYHGYHGEGWEDIKNEKPLLYGDTLALFIWREIKEAEGNAEAAARMMRTVYKEIAAVENALVCCWIDPEFNPDVLRQNNDREQKD